MATFVDWGLGRRVAGALAADGPAGTPPDGVAAAAKDGLARALSYSGLEPAARLPEPETVDRPAWIESNLEELRALAAPLEERAAGEVPLPGPLGGIALRVLGAAGGVEVGVVTGYAARRVLGQYQVSLAGRHTPPRLLFVGPNLAGAIAELGVERAGFLRWVAIHEQTHTLQFAAVPWLRGHLAGEIGRLIDAAGREVDLRALAGLARRLVTSDPRKTLRDALRGELARSLAGPGQAALLDRLQATMAVIEGYAEHVMDAAADDDPELATMRARLERRRERTGLGDAIARALGLGMKLRQYELGKRWSDGVVAEAGIEGLNRVWAEPDSLPSLSELERPGDWLDRLRGARPASARA